MWLRALAAPYVHAVGDDLRARIESHRDPRLVDHVWITMDAGIHAPVMVSVNTTSRRNRDAGFDDRIRLGTLRGSWTMLPPRGFAASRGQSYESLEKSSNIFFEHMDQEAMENFLIDTTHRAIRLEVWGAPYHRRTKPGIHQIHSRRASCAVREDIVNQDGLLQFYFAENSTLLVLMKFCGQP